MTDEEKDQFEILSIITAALKEKGIKASMDGDNGSAEVIITMPSGNEFIIRNRNIEAFVE